MSFKITNAMREQVAIKLTLQAVAKHGPVIGAKLSKLNQQYWEAHCEAAEALPGLERKHWPSLIQAGAVAAASISEVRYNKPVEGRDYSSLCEFDFVYGEYRKDALNNLIDALVRSPAFADAAQLIARHRHSSCSWVICLKSPFGSVPRLNSMATITDAKWIKQAQQINEQMQEIVQAAYNFHNEVSAVLASCRTSRQVEDLLPEAAKLLPQPAKVTQALAPVELAASVRNMLNKGVPPKVAA